MPWLELVAEMVQREAYYTLYLAVVGIWFAIMGFRGLIMGETRGFGWRSGPATGEQAVAAGRIWGTLGTVLLGGALYFIVT
jgi:hypothetical protein